MKSKEEVETILSDSSVDKKHELLNVLLESNFSYEELSCMFIGIMFANYPLLNKEAFIKYCEVVKQGISQNDQELDQLDD